MRKQYVFVAGATAAVLALGTVAAAEPWKVQSTAQLSDLATLTAEATDGAQAHVTAEPIEGGTRVRLKVTGFDHDAVGRTFGAHVHTGPCLEGDGAAAGPHFNHDAGFPTSANEVWLDLTVEQGGVAETVAEVGFEIPAGGAHSVVVHALPTGVGGVAGARIACLPVDF